MTMRLQEIHPALVHFPIALLPTTLIVDGIARMADDPALLEVGRRGIAVAAGSAALSAVAGLVSQEASKFDQHARDVLITHRNLNVGLVGWTFWMAARRARRERPSLRYLLAGLAGVGVMSYSAYLGGHMVYEHGAGVKDAGGLNSAEAPHLRASEAREVMRTSVRHIITGAQDAIAELARGNLIPWLTKSHEAGGAELDG